MPDTRPIRVALCARVSTNNHGQDVTVQTRELKEFIERRGWRLCAITCSTEVFGPPAKCPKSNVSDSCR
jgi:hypothetical protein